MWGMIGTWRMALEGIQLASQKLERGSLAEHAVVESISIVESNPYFKSVGYGGLPNERMEVELDAGFMHGTSWDIGAVAGIKNIAHPIQVAHHLSKERINSFLVGEGAEAFARQNNFEEKEMLTQRAKSYYLKRKNSNQLKPYDGHDTVGIIAVDIHQNICVGTSTSGLFMKHPGRVGDSPLVGSGFYADSQIGAATTTGLGEDLMRSCVSKEIVDFMGSGFSPQKACEHALNRLVDQLVQRRSTVGDLSVIAMNNKGEFGVATTLNEFSFVVAAQTMEPTVFVTKKMLTENKISYEKASESWLEKYMYERMKPIEEMF